MAIGADRDDMIVVQQPIEDGGGDEGTPGVLIV